MGSESKPGNGASPPATYFAPPERADADTLAREGEVLSASPLVQAIIESVDGYLMILNPQRQVLAMNQELLEILGVEKPDCFVGNRPGEIIGCIHVPDGPSGCGTSKACATCGAVLAILKSQCDGNPVSGECLATVNRDDHTEPLEFRVRSTPIHVAGHSITVLIFNDISDEKRRHQLERTFFHDVQNTIGGLLGWSTLLESVADLDPREVANRIVSLSRRLSEEIQDQRRLLQAEEGSMVVEKTPTVVSSVFDTLRAVFESHEVAKGRALEIADPEGEIGIDTDASLLLRVLTNMIKNALEASAGGEVVRAWAGASDGEIVFRVWNPGQIPEDVAPRIFQRSFSTKAAEGRGIGTHSMKLFGERYLGGRVWFETSEEGTLFAIALPSR